MDDDELLNRVATAFEAYTIPAAEVSSIRKAISNYLSSLIPDADASSSASNQDFEIPEFVQGVHRRYLEAVRENAAAKRRQTAILDRSNLQIQDDVIKVDKHEGESSPILEHVKVLRLRRQYSRLTILQHYADELKKLSSHSKIHEASDIRGIEDEIQLWAVDDTTTSVDNARLLISKLEQAVIRAKHESLREKARLQAAKASLTTAGSLIESAQLRALGAVRQELTLWLEQSLARCNAETVTEPVLSIDEDETVVTEDQVQDAYEAYLKEREKLLAVSMRLSAPLPGTEEMDDLSTMPQSEQKPRGKHTTDQLLAVEKVHYKQQQRNDETQIDRYIASQTEGEQSRILEKLERLADESQLLPAYPILARSGRFQQAKAVFGDRDVKISDDKITEKVEAWTFASEAAADTANSAISGHVRQGMVAANGVQELMQDLSFLQRAVETAGHASVENAQKR